MRTDLGEARERIAKKFFGMEPGMPEWFAYDSALREMSNLVLDRAIAECDEEAKEWDMYPGPSLKSIINRLRAMKEE